MFLGTFEPQGLLFVEADLGSLQLFIDHHFEEVSLDDKVSWRWQAAEAIAYVHEKGIIHSDLRPDNFPLYSAKEGSKSNRLYDFGVNGGHLPDAGFFDTRKPWVSTEQTDIFSLGSVFYTIMEGRWPYRPRGQLTSDDHQLYTTEVDQLFRDSISPRVDHLHGRSVIHGCWSDRYNRAIDILQDHRRLMGVSSAGEVSIIEG